MGPRFGIELGSLRQRLFPHDRNECVDPRILRRDTIATGRYQVTAGNRSAADRPRSLPQSQFSRIPAHQPEPERASRGGEKWSDSF